MNLLQKLQHYYHLRKLNIRNAWIKSPLTDDDYWLITMIVCIILILSVLSYANEIDSMNVSLIQNNQSYAQKVANLSHLNTKQELIIVSMLQGSVKIDGRIKTMCIINAAGDCE